MNLTPVERITLVNQCRILEKLYPDEADSYRGWREALEGGFTLHYDECVPWLSDNEMSPDECREVLDILDMYSQLAYSYSQLADKSGIREHSIGFPGFDGNNECSYLAYASFLINTQGKWQDLKDSGDGLNSHGPFLDAYRRMLEVWRPVRSRQLSKETIIAMLDAQIHPSRRAELAAK